MRTPSMSKSLIGIVMLLFGMIATWIEADEPSQQHAIAQRVVVRSEDIGVNTVIHGKLGIPLGRMSTIQGRCVRRGDPKDDDNRMFFSIARIDGKAVDHSVALRLIPFGSSNDDSLRVGRSYELRGYEHGRFRGVPNDANQEYVRGGKPPVATLTGYSFETEFLFISARPIEEKGR